MFQRLYNDCIVSLQWPYMSVHTSIHMPVRMSVPMSMGRLHYGPDAFYFHSFVSSDMAGDSSLEDIGYQTKPIPADRKMCFRELLAHTLWPSTKVNTASSLFRFALGAVLVADGAAWKAAHLRCGGPNPQLSRARS